jgi:gamma-glutamyltranspeptidase/glutathione hydrolase
MLQVFLNVALFGMSPQEAVEAPRVATQSFPDSFWPHASFPGVLKIESRIHASVADGLTALGHRVSAWPDWTWRAGAVCAIAVGEDGTKQAGADPRRSSHAIGW